MTTATLETLTLEQLLDQAQEIENFEIYIAPSGYRLPFTGLGEAKRVTNIEWASRYIDCENCDDGEVEVDAGGYTSHSVNQVFVKVGCKVCEGSGKVRKVCAVLVGEA